MRNQTEVKDHLFQDKKDKEAIDEGATIKDRETKVFKKLQIIK